MSNSSTSIQFLLENYQYLLASPVFKELQKEIADLKKENSILSNLLIQQKVYQQPTTTRVSDSPPFYKVEKVIEPVVEPVVKPVIEKVVEPVIEKVVEPVIEKVVEPVIEKVVEPVVEKEQTIEEADEAEEESDNKLYYKIATDANPVDLDSKFIIVGIIPFEKGHKVTYRYKNASEKESDDVEEEESDKVEEEESGEEEEESGEEESGEEESGEEESDKVEEEESGEEESDKVEEEESGEEESDKVEEEEAEEESGEEEESVEEEEVVEEADKVEEEVEEESVEEEEAGEVDLTEVIINGKKYYMDESSGDVYEILEDEEAGEIIGKMTNGVLTLL